MNISALLVAVCICAWTTSTVFAGGFCEDDGNGTNCQLLNCTGINNDCVPNAAGTGCECVAQAGAIEVFKQADLADGTEFPFEISGPDVDTSFTLTNGEGRGFLSLVSGDYTIREILPSGWDLGGVHCIDEDVDTVADFDVDLANHQVVIHLSQGQLVTCEFTNVFGHLTVFKQSNPDTGIEFLFDVSGPDVDTSFPLASGGQEGISQLASGDYTIREILPSGWALADVHCIGEDIDTIADFDVDLANHQAVLHLSPGQFIDCNFANVPASRIIINKDADPADGTDFEFVLEGEGLMIPGVADDAVPDDGDGIGDQVIFDHLLAGSYTVTELPLPDWDLTSISCSRSDGVLIEDASVTIDLESGEDVTCTFENFKRRRTSANTKGSVLIYSKIEVKWDVSGNVIQDTFLDISNDYPQDVVVQGYFINGDTEVQELLDQSGGILQTYEPGWNTADCRFELTANQPHYWSAANGSDKCQPFTVLDDEGPGRLDPESTDDARVLRGFAVFWAQRLREFPPGGSVWWTINWNHLKGDAVIVNYADGTAWEYNAWAFQARESSHGGLVGNGFETMQLDGVEFDSPYASLLLDFYASGSTVLSGGGESVMVDTDLTLHAVSADLRQDGCGPVLTKVEADIWNEFESKFSGTRRCICCWDQTMLSDWVRSVLIPNHFMRDALRTDNGKARLDGVHSTECDYEELCGTTAKMKRWNNCADTIVDPSVAGQAGSTNGFFDGSEDAAILGLATKFIAFSPSGKKDTAGMNLVGAGTEPAYIQYDPIFGPQEARDGSAHAKDKHRTNGRLRDGTLMRIDQTS